MNLIFSLGMGPHLHFLLREDQVDVASKGRATLECKNCGDLRKIDSGRYRWS